MNNDPYTTLADESYLYQMEMNADWEAREADARSDTADFIVSEYGVDRETADRWAADPDLDWF